jgi:broad specificity phosphatase PhoE
MKRNSCIWAIVFVVLLPAVAAAQQLVILVRHAERADASGMPPPASADPSLSAAGKARAAKLATMLADAGVKGIFTTEFKRTQETAAPLATKLTLKAQSMAADDTAALVAKIRSAHPKDVVLVVGHSNTVPEVVKAFGGPAVTIADTEFDNIFIIAPATGAFTKIRYSNARLDQPPPRCSSSAA